MLKITLRKYLQWQKRISEHNTPQLHAVLTENANTVPQEEERPRDESLVFKGERNRRFPEKNSNGGEKLLVDSSF